MSPRSRILRPTIALAAAGALLAACADSDADPTAETADASAVQATSPTPTDEGSTQTDQVGLPAGVLPLPEPDVRDEAVVTEAGRYRIRLSDTLSADVDLPVETVVNSDGLYLQLGDGLVKVEAAGQRYGVPPDPCHAFNDIQPAGTTDQDLVTAIRNQPLYRTSRPAAVTIGGTTGRHLQLRVPRGFDASTCTDGQVGLPGNPGSSNNMEPGYAGHWWILDAAGQRAVVQTYCDQCDPSTSSRLDGVVHSITFTPAP
jgi:hypothetical protein